MKKIYLYLLLLLIPTIIFSQESASFKLKDIIYLKENKGEKVDSFLKSRFFDYAGKDLRNECYNYGLNYDEQNETATIWVYKYFDGKVKILESGEGLLLEYIKGELKPYIDDFEYQEDAWTMTYYYYKSYALGIRENDKLERRELFIEDKI